MRKLLFILLLLSSVVRSQVLIFGALVDTAITPPPVWPSHITGITFSGKTTIIVGDSYVAGAGASTSANRWTTKFCAGRSTSEGSAGYPGATVETGPCPPVFVPSAVPTYSSGTHCALIIALGINDVGWNNGSYTPAAYKIAYQDIIDDATGKGWPVNRIICLTPYKPIDYDYYVGSCSVSVPADGIRAAAYNAKVQEICTTNGTWFIDIYTAMNGLDVTYFDPDELHPNDAGHLFIADFLIDYL